jgi:hypothetical protein
VEDILQSNPESDSLHMEVPILLNTTLGSTSRTDATIHKTQAIKGMEVAVLWCANVGETASLPFSLIWDSSQPLATALRERTIIKATFPTTANGEQGWSKPITRGTTVVLRPSEKLKLWPYGNVKPESPPFPII